MRPSFALFKKIFAFKRRRPAPIQLCRTPNFLSFEEVSFLQDHLDVGLKLTGVDCSAPWLNRMIDDFFMKPVCGKKLSSGQVLMTCPMDAKTAQQLASGLGRHLGNPQLFHNRIDVLEAIACSWLHFVEAEEIAVSSGRLSVMVEILNGSKTKKLIFLRD